MRRDDSAAYAANWRTVLLVDGLVGLAVVVGGFLLGTYGNVLALPVVVLGVAYLVLVGRRLQHWRRLRNEAGL